VKVLTAVLLLFAAGCASVGPRTIRHDRFDNAEAIADSWKRQMLMNIVKMRYGEPPVFLDVASIINQYAVGGQVSAGVALGGQIGGGDVTNLGANARYEDRPTITYQPLTGQKFTRSLLSPIQPQQLLTLVEAGYPVDFLCRIGLRSINTVRNRSDIAFLQQDQDPRFDGLLEAMRRVQRSGALGMRVIRSEAGEGAILFFRSGTDPTVDADIASIRSTLGLEESRSEFEIRFGFAPSHAGEIAVLTRSMLEMMLELGADIQVPAEHLRDGRVAATSGGPGGELIHILSQKDPPEEPYTAVRFDDHWFFVDRRDLDSKRLMSFLLVLLSLAESGRESAAPLVTIGAGGP
jgi:hypothetical protein